MEQKNKKSVRLILYFIGLFIMTIGIALLVKSDLGVSPVSSIPYTMTCIWGIEMGKATILFHCILVAMQIILLRRTFEIRNILQILVGIVFGYFTTFCNWGASFLPTPQNLVKNLYATRKTFHIPFPKEKFKRNPIFCFFYKAWTVRKQARKVLLRNTYKY